MPLIIGGFMSVTTQDSLVDYCQRIRHELFPFGFLSSWLHVQGPLIELTLPFPATKIAQEIVEQDEFLKHYQWTYQVKVDALPRKTNTKAISCRNVIAVASGKGGVGKSSVTVNLALAMSAAGARVGILDADIFGPSLPTMLGNKDAKPVFVENKKMQPIEQYGLQVNSLGYLTEADDAAVWRGPMASRALEQLCFDTRWNNLDYLFIDMPPGTGDIQLTLAQKLPVTGAVLVSTPQEVALADVIKGMAMFNKVDVPVFGLIENMSYYCCENCDHKEYIFGQGGGAALAEKHQLPLLGEWPLMTTMRQQLDDGNPLIYAQPEHEFSQIIQRSAASLAANAWYLSAPDAPEE